MERPYHAESCNRSHVSGYPAALVNTDQQELSIDHLQVTLYRLGRIIPSNVAPASPS